MKNLKTIVIVIFINWTTPAFANQYHIFFGSAINFSDLFSIIRVGTETWEGGKIRSDMIGVNKIFKNSGSTYTTLGLGLLSPADLGFFAGAGFDYRIFSGLSVRGELNAAGSFAGYLSGVATFGVSWRF